jgi:hypothetical protein
MVPAHTSAHLQATVAWLAGASLLALILTLAGALPVSTGVLDVISVTSAASILVVLVLVYAQLGPTTAWGLVGLTLAIAGLTLVLVGDALQHVVLTPGLAANSDKATLWALSFAARDGIGNSLFYASLLIAGGLLAISGARWLGGLAVINAVLGYLDLAFASALGLPPHTNFLLLVVWLGLLGVTWWRDGIMLQQTRVPSSTPVVGSHA